MMLPSLVCFPIMLHASFWFDLALDDTASFSLECFERDVLKIFFLSDSASKKKRKGKKPKTKTNTTLLFEKGKGAKKTR